MKLRFDNKLSLTVEFSLSNLNWDKFIWSDSKKIIEKNPRIKTIIIGIKKYQPNMAIPEKTAIIVQTKTKNVTSANNTGA